MVFRCSKVSGSISSVFVIFSYKPSVVSISRCRHNYVGHYVLYNFVLKGWEFEIHILYTSVLSVLFVYLNQK